MRAGEVVGTDNGTKEGSAMKSELIAPEKARKAAKRLGEEWGLEGRLARYRRWQIGSSGEIDWGAPQVHLEDVTGIPFVAGVPGVEEYQHRARVRVREGDIFAAGSGPAEGYEAYCRDLGLGTAQFLYAHGENPMAVAAACQMEEPLEVLVRRAAQAGGLILHPYMSIESVWGLAEAISAKTAVSVKVMGPPPPTLWVANDKFYFSQVVKGALDASWIVETRSATTQAGLAATLYEMVRRHEWVGLKRTRCASAMGNKVFSARELGDQSIGALEEVVGAFLEATQWPEGEEVLVVEWRPTDVSPSTQLWIPPVDEGPVRLDGVYEQILDGVERVFVGSRPSTLPEALNEALGAASVQVATVLQAMGYVGRCSFDFIVTGDVNGAFEARFTECNGRWGGTSTPMHLVDRLHGSGSVGPKVRPAYIATDLYLPERLSGMSFEGLKARLGADLYDAATGTGRFVLYNVGPLKRNRKFDLVSLGESAEDARYGLEEVLAGRLG